MFKHLKYLATLLVLTQLFVLTFPAQSTYGLDTKDTATSFYESGRSKYYLKDYRGAIQDFDGCLDLYKAGKLGSSTAYDLKKYCN